MSCVQAVFFTLLKSFGEISPKSKKSYQVLHHHRYICIQLGNFYQNFDKEYQPTVV